VIQIAYNLGFNDFAYFTRFLTKHIGRSQKQFRQTYPLNGQLDDIGDTLQKIT